LLSYAIKRISRSWKLFAALALGMTLAATFFGGLNVAADTVGKQALDAQLVNTPVDMNLQPEYSLSSSYFQNVTSSVDQVSGVAAAESIGTAYSYNSSYPNIEAIQDNSLLYQHMTLVSGRKTLNANETLINADSALAQDFPVNQTVRYTIGSYYAGSKQSKYNVTLTVVGTVSLDATAEDTLDVCSFPSPFGVQQPNSGCVFSTQQQSVFITSWDKTFIPIVNWDHEQFLNGTGNYSISSQVDVYLDRDRLISAFDVGNSISQIQRVEARVSSVAQEYGFSSNDYLISQLQGFSQEIFLLRLQFTVVAIPVFFLAWYVGQTVSQSSFNLRRKEIGLLMTRGFTRTQLFRQFLTEGLIVGLIAGTAGLALAYALNPVFIQALGGGVAGAGATFLSTDTIITTILFTLFLTLFSVLAPARQAAAMDPAQALKEYVYVEETKPSRKRWAILAFVLGLYQLTLLSLGMNYMTLSQNIFAANFLLAIILIVATVLSYALTYIGPFLFLYGAASLSTGLAKRFHKSFTRISRRVVGDFAALASKNVFRNPRRVAALVFIVALIVGYSVWVIGDQASQQDYNLRQAEAQTGSDIRLSGINSIANATLIADQLRTGWSNITGATREADFSQYFYPYGSLQIRAIDPNTWRQGAYYEPGWFTGSLQGTFAEMAANNQTLVLDRGVASYYSIPIESRLNFSTTVSASVIGFFGPDYSQSTSSFQPEGWSFIPINLLTQNITQFPSTTNIVLAKVASGVSLSAIAQSLQRAYPSLTVSTDEVPSTGVQGVVDTGSQNVLRLGTAFAGLAASIGVGAVAYTGYREREKEITIAAVRGLSYRQLAGLLITEFLPLVVYALILASAVGLIVVWGDAQAQNSLNSSYLALLEPRRVVFPLWASENILAIVALLLAGVFIPAAFAARKDLSKMSRTVRFA
jgi:ABC-type antimicrobial peptide transport system permease subunit